MCVCVLLTSWHEFLWIFQLNSCSILVWGGKKKSNQDKLLNSASFSAEKESRNCKAAEQEQFSFSLGLNEIFFSLSLSHGIRTSFLFIHTVVICHNKEPLLRSSCGLERGALQIGTWRPVERSDLDRAPQFSLEIHFQSLGWKEPGHRWDLQRLNVTQQVSCTVLTCCPWFHVVKMAVSQS